MFAPLYVPCVVFKPWHAVNPYTSVVEARQRHEQEIMDEDDRRECHRIHQERMDRQRKEEERRKALGV